MEWSKVKNIIILVLVLVNGFLLVLVGARWRQARRYEQSTLEQAIQVLDNNGIRTDREALTAADSLSAQSAQRDPAWEARLAQGLLDEAVREENRGGGLYIYEGSRGQVSLRAGGELSALLEEDPRWYADEPESHAAGLIRDMGLKAQLLRTDLRDGAGTVTFRQLWDGAPLFQCELTFTYQGGRLTQLSGALLAAEETTAEEGEILPLATALLRFLDHILTSGDVCSEIRSMEPGYLSTQSFSGAVRLDPVWHIGSNTADYYLDAVTGELTRMADG